MNTPLDLLELTRLLGIDMIKVKENDFRIITQYKEKSISYGAFPMLVGTYLDFHSKGALRLWDLTKKHQVQILNHLFSEGQISRSTYQSKVKEIQIIDTRWKNFPSYLKKQNESDLLIFSKNDYESMIERLNSLYQNARLIDLGCRMNTSL